MKKSITPEYRAWKAMRNRCRSGSPDRAWYFDKGITVCERWDQYTFFFADMGRRPSPEHSLDRIDGSKGYLPENCRWADNKTQRRNRSSVTLCPRKAHQVRWLGEMGYTQWAIARMFGMTQAGINHVLRGRSWT